MRRALILIVAIALGVVGLSATAAVAATDGTLRGKVTDGSSGIEGICVDVHPADDARSRMSYSTGIDGTWAASLPAGAYKLRYHDCTSGTWAQEWHVNVLAFEDATPVNVTAGSETVVAAQALAPAASITGKVVDDSGTALSGMCVVAQSQDHPSIRSETKSGSGGAFAVGGLPAGSYVVYGFDCRSDAPASQANAYYSGGADPARGPQDAEPVVVTSGAATTLAASLVLPDSGTLTGLVYGSTYLPNMCVTAIDLAANVSIGAITDGNGRYSVAGLLPGKWILRIDDCSIAAPEERYATTFLLGNGATSADANDAEESPIVVTAGTKALTSAGLDQGGIVAGKVTRAQNPDQLRTPSAAGDAVAGACVGATSPDSRRILASTTTDGAGAYSLSGLSPQLAYRVVAYNCDNATPFGLEWYGDSLAVGTAVGVMPQAGKTTPNVDFRVGSTVRRAAGADRVATANALALGVFKTASTVVVARAEIYADALAGGPLAAQRDAPMLLVPEGGLTTELIQTINTLQATHAVILGGTGSIPLAVEQDIIQRTSVATTERVGGTNRFDTARKIAAQLPVKDRAFVVEGINSDPSRGWPDAVSSAGLAAQEGVPLVLVTRDSVPAASQDVLRGRAQVHIIGGSGAVSAVALSQIDAIAGTVTRISGASRYGTSAGVAELALRSGAWSRTLWIATGARFPDSLVAAAAVAQDGGVLMLIDGQDSSRSPQIESFLTRLSGSVDRVVILGGKGSVTSLTETRIKVLLRL